MPVNHEQAATDMNPYTAPAMPDTDSPEFDSPDVIPLTAFAIIGISIASTLACFYLLVIVGCLKRFTQDAKQIGFCGLSRIDHHQAFDSKGLRGESWQLIFTAADVANAFRDVDRLFQFFNG